MKPVYLLSPNELSTRIDEYFEYIKGGDQNNKPNVKPESKSKATKTRDREPEHPTVTGLAHFLGFSSRVQFNKYRDKSKFSKVLHRALLRIESIYEQRLHTHSTSGAIFVLKSLGWSDSKISNIISENSLNIKIIETGPQPANSEKEVVIEN